MYKKNGPVINPREDVIKVMGLMNFTIYRSAQNYKKTKVKEFNLAVTPGNIHQN